MNCKLFATKQVAEEIREELATMKKMLTDIDGALTALTRYVEMEAVAQENGYTCGKDTRRRRRRRRIWG